jgi:prephenate dehydrogenase
MADADVVVVAAPVGALARAVADALAVARPDAVVTDVGSVKGPLVAAVDEPRLVAGHPLAGGESAGIGHARGDLFAGATWYLVPGPRSSGVAFERVHRFLAALGARPVAIDPETHDRVMAAVSHLPHVLANVLVAQAAQALGGEAMPATGPSFRDATRVAGANPELWAQIYAANAGALGAQLDAVIARLEDVRGRLHDLEGWQAEAAAHRRALLETGLEGGPWRRSACPCRTAPGWSPTSPSRWGAPASTSPTCRSAPPPTGPRGRRPVGRAGRRRPRSPAHLRERTSRRMTEGPLFPPSARCAASSSRPPTSRCRTGRPARRDGLRAHGGAQLPRRGGHPVDAGRGPPARGAGAGERDRRGDPRGPARDVPAPDGPIDVGNAGTLMRLLPGWLAAQSGRSHTLDGDASIRRRPVDRIAEPLRPWAAGSTRGTGAFPPFTVHGEALRGIRYALPVASAQVKSCVLLAGLSADGPTSVVEPAPSRDHTERMLLAGGADLTRDGDVVSVRPGCRARVRRAPRPRRPVLGGVPDRRGRPGGRVAGAPAQRERQLDAHGLPADPRADGRPGGGGARAAGRRSARASRSARSR